ncbi:hypothetical protein EB001_10370 [bacterium]|jgi:hypothetical protein|nr:hypothetical protein [bacterium]
MSKLEIFRINENGAGWVDFNQATTSELLDVELGLITNQIKMNCFKCHVEIPRGNVCVNHKDVKGGIYLD